MTNTVNSECNIIILGCGLSGMLTALAFARHGIKTTIIESKSIIDPIFFNDIRTTALTDSSKSFFSDILLVIKVKAKETFPFTVPLKLQPKIEKMVYTRNKMNQRCIYLCCCIAATAGAASSHAHDVLPLSVVLPMHGLASLHLRQSTKQTPCHESRQLGALHSKG